MKPRVHLETTIPSYLTAWPSRDLVLMGHQRLTRLWWENERALFELVVSQVVIDECQSGDLQAASLRLAAIEGLPILASAPAVTSLAEELIAAMGLPRKAKEDAWHLAYAAVHGVEYLLTWNCRHIANGRLRANIGRACAALGHRAPTIVTPLEMLGDAADVP